MLGISGPPLNDGYHFGQTLINDYGRPYQRGFDPISGFSGWANWGRIALYVRGEYQHSPSAPAYSQQVRDLISQTAVVPVPSGNPLPTINQFTLLDTYALTKLANWDISFLLLCGVALLIPNRYQSSARLMPPDNQSSSGLAMAAMAFAGGSVEGAGSGGERRTWGPSQPIARAQKHQRFVGWRLKQPHGCRQTDSRIRSAKGLSPPPHGGHAQAIGIEYRNFRGSKKPDHHDYRVRQRPSSCERPGWGLRGRAESAHGGGEHFIGAARANLFGRTPGDGQPGSGKRRERFHPVCEQELHD